MIRSINAQISKQYKVKIFKDSKFWLENLEVFSVRIKDSKLLALARSLDIRIRNFKIKYKKITLNFVVKIHSKIPMLISKFLIFQRKLRINKKPRIKKF